MSRLLLLLALVALVFWTLGSKRQPPSGNAPPPTPSAPPPAPPSGPQTIVACAQCGLHLPLGDALPGRGGVFCSTEHRAAFEAEHAPRS